MKALLQFLDAVPDAMLACDEEGMILTANRRSEELFGYSHEELKDRSVLTLMPDELKGTQGELVQSYFQQNELRERERHLELMAERKDLSQFPLHMRVEVYQPTPEDPGLLLVALRDVSVRQQKEREIAESETRFRNLLENAPDGVLLCDRNGIIKRINPHIEVIFGFTAEELDKRTFEFLIPERLREEYSEKLERYFEDPDRRNRGRNVELFGKHRDGRIFPIEVNLSPMDEPGGMQVLASVRDVTERQERERELKQQKERSERLMESAPDGMLVADSKGIIKEANSQLEELFGYPRDEIVGSSVEILMPKRFRATHGDRIIQFFTSPDRREMGQGRELFGERKNGEEFPIEISLSPFQQDGKFHVISSVRDVSFRHAQHKQLERERKRFQTLIETTPDGIVVLNLEGEIQEGNGQLETLLRQPLQNLVGQKLDRFFEEEEQVSFRDYLKGVFEGAQSAISFHAPGEEGEGRILEMQLGAMTVGAEKLATGPIRDITQRRQEQLRMKASELRFRSLMDSAPDGMIVSRRNGVVDQVNDQLCQIFGYEKEELVGRSVEFMMPERFRAGHAAHLRRFFSNPKRREMGRGLELSGARKDGTEFPIEISLSPIDSPEGPIVISSVRDVTFRHEQEALMKESEKRFRTLVANIPGTIYRRSFDLTWTTQFVSENVQTLSGYPAADFLKEEGRTLRSLIHIEDYADVAARIEKAVRAGESWRVEYRLVREDGATRWAEETGRAVLDDHGTVTSLDGVIVDISERREMQAQLELAQQEADAANRAKSEFLSHMSHELRTPLNGILGYSQVLQRSTGLTKKDRTSAEAIISCGDHLLTLINDVLDLSKIEAGRLEADLEATDLHRLLESVVSILRSKATEKEIDLKLEVGPEVPLGVTTDPPKVRQVLVNLIGNALKFTPEKGKVTLSVREMPEKDFFRFRVEDTGVGMTEEEMSVIFDPFQQVAAGKAEGGTGLGLAICIRIARLLGGDLKVSSRKGKGSRFDFLIPMEETESLDLSTIGSNELDTSHLSLPEGTSYRILLADDRPVNLDILELMLQAMGFETLLADDGDTALGILRKGEKVDLFLSDVRMPRMNGIDLVQEIRKDENLKTLKVVAVTASVFPEFRQKAVESGFDAFLPKPFRAAELVQVLEEQLAVKLVAAAGKSEGDGGSERSESFGEPVKGGEGLTPTLLEEIRQAITSRNFSVAKSKVAEIKDHALREDLEECLRTFDFPGGLKCLEGVEAPSAPTSSGRKFPKRKKETK